MNIDRTLQNHVLHFLKSHYDIFIEERLIYATCIDGFECPDLSEQFELFLKIKVDMSILKHLRENLIYLSAHGLLEQKA